MLLGAPTNPYKSLQSSMELCRIGSDPKTSLTQSTKQPFRCLAIQYQNVLSNVLFKSTSLSLVVSSGHPFEVINTGHWTRQSALNSYLCGDGTAIEVLAITHLVTAPPRKLLATPPSRPPCPARLWPNDEAMVGQ